MLVTPGVKFSRIPYSFQVMVTVLFCPRPEWSGKGNSPPARNGRLLALDGHQVGLSQTLELTRVLQQPDDRIEA